MTILVTRRGPTITQNDNGFHFLCHWCGFIAARMKDYGEAQHIRARHRELRHQKRRKEASN